jgi:hypothetical protein
VQQLLGPAPVVCSRNGHPHCPAVERAIAVDPLALISVSAVARPTQILTVPRRLTKNARDGCHSAAHGLCQSMASASVAVDSLIALLCSMNLSGCRIHRVTSCLPRQSLVQVLASPREPAVTTTRALQPCGKTSCAHQELILLFVHDGPKTSRPRASQYTGR